MIPLRTYQEEAIAAVNAALAQGKRRFVVNLPTGTGKTILALSIVASSLRKKSRVLWIAHREELIAQTAESFFHVAPDLDDALGIVKAERDERNARFIIASIQTLWGRDRAVERERAELEEASSNEEAAEIQRRLNALPPPSFPRWDALNPKSFDLIVYDECQHSMSPSALKLLEDIPASSMLLGLSATPFRGDNLSLAHIFSDGIVYQFSLKRAIREGHLCEFKYQSVWLDIDLDNVKTTAGDYNATQLEAALEQAGVVEATVKGIVAHAPLRKALVFTFTITQAKATAAGLSAAGLPAKWLSCNTPKDERRKILADFHAGSVRYLANCAVLTEGYDEPSVDCVVIARPTKSKPLYQQMVGRGLRPGKPDCLILDFVGVGSKNAPASVNDLIGIIPQPGETSEAAEIRQEAEREAANLPQNSVGLAMLAAAARAREERKAFAAAWVVLRSPPRGVTEAHCVSGSQKRKVVVYTESDPDRWKVVVWLTGGDFYRIEQRGVTLDFAQSIGHQVMRDMGQRALMEDNAAWRRRPPSQKTLDMAAKCHIALDPAWNGGEVSNAINAVTAGWDLAATLAGKRKQRELFFETPETFKEALAAERAAAKEELVIWRQNKNIGTT